jgi:hypothetical protein
VSSGAANAGFSGVDHFGPGAHGLNTVFTDPSRIRSRFAAFNPAKRDSADLLAGAYPWAMPIGAGLLASMLYGQQE